MFANVLLLATLSSDDSWKCPKETSKFSMVSAIWLVKCIFFASVGVPSKKYFESRVIKYDSNIGCFFVCYYPKIPVNVQFNSFNSPQILPAEWWDFDFFGGDGNPYYSWTLFPGFSLSRYISCFNLFQMFVCAIFFFVSKNGHHPLFHQPLGVSGRSLGCSLKMRWRIGDGPMEASKRSSNIWIDTCQQQPVELAMEKNGCS